MRIRCTIGLRKVYRENMALESRKPFVAGVLVGVLATLVFMGTAVLLVSRSPSVENRYKEIDALFQEYKNPIDWKRRVTKFLVDETDRTTNLVRDCSLIYNRGEKGKL